MSPRLSEETLFWMRLAAFASLSEYVLSTDASADDAEDFLLGLSLPTTEVVRSQMGFFASGVAIVLMGSLREQLLYCSLRSGSPTTDITSADTAIFGDSSQLPNSP